MKSIFPLETKLEKEIFKVFVDSYIKARYRIDYKVEVEVMEYLLEIVGKFQQWMLPECLRRIDEFVPSKNYSFDHVQVGSFLDLKQLKNKEKQPRVVIEKQIEELKSKDKALATALEQTEKALAREEILLDLVKLEKNENERLLQKLNDLGINPKC